MAKTNELWEAEQALLRGLSNCRSLDVQISADPAEHVHTLVMDLKQGGLSTPESGSGDAKPCLVYLHGYGLGAGVSSMLISSLAKIITGDVQGKQAVSQQAGPFDTVYIVDWPGSGLSSAFGRERALLTLTCNHPQHTSHADGVLTDSIQNCYLNTQSPDLPPPETDPSTNLLNLLLYACHALEQWRHAMDIQRMAVAGHSLGGYLAFCYCEWKHALLQKQASHLTAVVPHLILVSPCGLPTRPDFLVPHQSEEAYRECKAQDLAEGRRQLSEFDEGSRNRTRFRRFFRFVVYPSLCLCAPCAGIIYCCARRRKKDQVHNSSLEPDPSPTAETITAPVSRALRTVRWDWVCRLAIRVLMRQRFEDNGQWAASGQRARLAHYLFQVAAHNAALQDASRQPSFSEHLFHHLMFPPSYSSFGWTRAPLAGTCRPQPINTVEFFGSAAPKGETHGRDDRLTLPFSSGRLQNLLRSVFRSDQENDKSRFRLSFIYGDEDWMDLRYAADACREFVDLGGRADIDVVSKSGHQLPLDNPGGLADSIVKLMRAA